MRVISRIERSWSQTARILPPVAVVLAAAALAAGCGSKNASVSTTTTTTTPTTTTTAAATTTVAAPVKIPASAAPQAKAYVEAHAAQLKRIRALEASVQIAISEVENSPLMTPLQQSTQENYSKTGAIVPKLQGPFNRGALGTIESRVYTSSKGIEMSMYSLLQYTAFPTPATLTEYTSEYQTAILAWNKAVKSIWLAAGVPKPPHICTSC